LNVGGSLSQLTLEIVQDPDAGTAQGTLYVICTVPLSLQQTVNCMKSPQFTMSDHCQQSALILFMGSAWPSSAAHSPIP